MFRFLKKRALGPGENLMREGEPPFAIYAEGDPAMQRAEEEARSTQDVFWKRFEASAYEFAVKAGLTTPRGGIEHIWLHVVRRDGDKIVGVLINEPVDLPDIHCGDEVVVDADRLSDWSYVSGGKLYGAFSTRVMCERMPEHERLRAQDMLSERPLETDPA